MRDDTPSRTAQFVAGARALGMLLPDQLRVAEDPYGLAFTSPRLASLAARGPRVLARVPGIEAWIVYMQVRTKLLDDVVRSFVDAGGDQVVLLGAGFDCRALRLPELAHARVYEVDHPATQSHKQRTLAAIGVDSPARYVTWNFEANPLDALPAALAQHGHDRTRPTLTIWEGVTMYLTEPAIDASLRAIADWSAPDSLLAVTYFPYDRLESRSLVVRAVRAAVARIGEPFTWGIAPEELPAFLAPRGWLVEDDVSTFDAAAELFPRRLAKLVKNSSTQVALARRAI